MMHAMFKQYYPLTTLQTEANSLCAYLISLLLAKSCITYILHLELCLYPLQWDAFHLNHEGEENISGENGDQNPALRDDSVRCFKSGLDLALGNIVQGNSPVLIGG